MILVNPQFCLFVSPYNDDDGMMFLGMDRDPAIKVSDARNLVMRIEISQCDM